MEYQAARGPENYTHIRRPEPPYDRYCGATVGGSVSRGHIIESYVKEEINGQIARLPQGICFACSLAMSQPKGTGNDVR